MLVIVGFEDDLEQDHLSHTVFFKSSVCSFLLFGFLCQAVVSLPRFVYSLTFSFPLPALNNLTIPLSPKQLIL